MEWMMRELCFDFLAQTGDSPVLQNIQIISEAQPASCSIGNWESYPGVKFLGHEAHHPPLSSAEAKNGWNYTTRTHIPSKHAQGWLHFFKIQPHRRFTKSFTYGSCTQHCVRKKRINILLYTLSVPSPQFCFFFLGSPNEPTYPHC